MFHRHTPPRYKVDLYLGLILNAKQNKRREIDSHRTMIGNNKSISVEKEMSKIR